MITIELDLTNAVVAVASSVVSILATWYFSRRHYMRTPPPVTENDITLESNKKEFRIIVVIALLVFLAIIVCMVQLNPDDSERESTTQPATKTRPQVFPGEDAAVGERGNSRTSPRRNSLLGTHQINGDHEHRVARESILPRHSGEYLGTDETLGNWFIPSPASPLLERTQRPQQSVPSTRAAKRTDQVGQS